MGGDGGTVQVHVPPPLGPVLVVHYKPNWQLDREDVREQHAGAAAGFIERLVGDQPAAKVIVVGDFDADWDAASIRFWTGRQSLQGTSVRYQDAWHARHRGEAEELGFHLHPCQPAGHQRRDAARGRPPHRLRSRALLRARTEPAGHQVGADPR